MRVGLILFLIILFASFASASQLMAEELYLKNKPPGEISLAENLLRGLSKRAKRQRISDGVWNIIQGIFPLAEGLHLVDWAERNDEKGVKKLGYFTAGIGALDIFSGIRALTFKPTQEKKYEYVLSIDNSTPQGKRARENAAAMALEDLARKAKIRKLIEGTLFSSFSLYWIIAKPFKGDEYSQYNYYLAGMWGLYSLLSFLATSDEEVAYKHYLIDKENRGNIKVYGGVLPGKGFFVKLKYSF